MKLKEIYESIYDRSKMPQIKGEDLGKAISILKKAKIPCEIVELFPKNLIHSQKQVDKKKVMRIITDISNGKKIPLIAISNDNYIIDGHHRQLAYNVLQPEKKIKVFKIDLPRDQALSVYKKIEKYLN